MTTFPNAKINIGLNITGKRDDGYHNIESLFYPVGVRDILEFVIQSPEKDTDELTVSGFPADCKMNENLVIRALDLLRTEYTVPPLRIHLHKAIPAGSGLGGGSSDAAFMLRSVCRYFRLEAGSSELTRLSLKIGSDCAFFIDNKPAIVTGRGEIVSQVNVSLEGYYIFLVHPGIHISTAEAYRIIKPSGPAYNLTDIVKEPPEEWKDIIKNDFQEAIIKKHPLIDELIKELYSAGAAYCSMSGSGSSVYGIFREKPGYGLLRKYWTWSGSL